MEQMAAAPTQTLQDSFPLLESASDTAGDAPEFNAPAMSLDGAVDGGMSTEMQPVDALTALVEQGQTNGRDDLTMIEGIGPQIADALRGSGIESFAILSATNPVQIKQILDDNGFGIHDPSTWPDQAQLAASGEWDKLREWQEELDGGRVVAGGSMVTATPAVNEVANPVEMDDLTKIEGIGPKIAEHLNSAGIDSFSALASISAEEIRGILDAAGGFAGSRSVDLAGPGSDWRPMANGIN